MTRQEIEEILANDGYSAGARKAWLKSLLTDVTKEQERNPSAKKETLIGEIKDAVDHFQNGKPMTDKNL